MQVVDQHDASESQSDLAATQNAGKSKKRANEDEVISIAENFSQAKANRHNAETAREKINSEIMEATKRLYQTLIEEGEQSLERGKRLEADSELRLLESQRELKHAEDLKAEADSYRIKVIAQTRQQSQGMLQEAQSIKADAVTFREKVLSDVKHQSALELNQAKSARSEADAYREQVISETQRQAEEILHQARLSAEREGSEIRQKYSLEAQKILARAEMIKEAAQEELEAQRLYSQAANLGSESREMLEQARAKISTAAPNSDAPFIPQESVIAEILQRANPTLHSHALPSIEENNNSEDSPAVEPADSSLFQVADSFVAEESADPEPDSRESQPNEESEPVSSCGPADETSVASLLPPNELVLGLEIDGQSKAYPMKTLSQLGVINDSLAGVNLLMTIAPPSELGMMFNRNLDGRTLFFESVLELDDGMALMKDLDTGTMWETLTGRAIRGALSGSELERMNPEYSFWFAWSQLHPQTELYDQV